MIPPDPPPSIEGVRGGSSPPAAGGLFLLIFLLILWEALSRLALLPPDAVPPVSVIGEELWGLIISGELVGQAGLTIGRALAGFGVGGVGGVALGFACGVFPGFGRAMRMTVEFLRPMPSVALIPIGILFLGLGFGLCVAVAGFACAWPAYVAAVAGAATAGPELRDTARVYGLRRWESIVFVLAPAALPQIMAGLRTGLAVAVAVVVTTEMAAAPNGLGSFILEASMAGRPGRMYAGIVAVGLVGAGLNAVFVALRRRALAWMPEAGQR
ncbi:ABC transporter permease subunit [Desulfovibrio aerotolerans]|uniref:ABC transporter permease subunit n=1 Tax=Solidesulfovibrio aerotolerans TaxID=295255 RepID=A0A7C9MZZ5_9BACT|nr:ABC transporter permease subunit [Solidesulfovibrio aerotolerans]MYL82757.1 ABC transporter permease subunit [Solidesulfovibrio aerotolerans]